MTAKLRSKIADILLDARADTLDALGRGPLSGAAEAAADMLAVQILDAIGRYLPLPLGSPSAGSALGAAGELVDVAQHPQRPAPRPADTLTLNHASSLDAELIALCTEAGLAFQGIGYHEGRPVIIATDEDGMREYYTMAALTTTAHMAGSARAHGSSPARRHSASGDLSACSPSCDGGLGRLSRPTRARRHS